MAGKAYIGTSGFTYDHWREVFYPPAVKQREWLEFYCRHFDTVEINTSYYHMPRPNVCAGWRQRSPDGFCFVMKMNGRLTHSRRLINCEEPLETFLIPVNELGEKLGPILVQLPPKFKADARRLDAFLDICPTQRRWAVEFRDPSWLCEDTYAVLRAHKAALVVHDLIPEHPRITTAAWTYLRFHGPSEEKYHGSYSDEMLRAAARRIKKHLKDGRDVYAYFNNDAHGHAVRNAASLIQFVSGRAGSAPRRSAKPKQLTLRRGE